MKYYPKKIIALVLALAALCGMLSIGASATDHTIKTGVGVVHVAAGSTLRLRSKASTSSKTLAFAPDGDIVIVEGKIGNWYKVIYNLQEGYMYSDYLNVTAVENVELGYGVVNDTRVNMRSGPGTTYTSLGKFTYGDKAYIIGINNQWYKVIYSGKICYIRSDYLDVTEIPYENKASSNKPLFFVDGKSTGLAVSADALNGEGVAAPDTPTQTPSEPEESVAPELPAGELAQAIIDTGKSLIGTPYVWGGTTPSGFDCSGFVQYIFRVNGVNIPRISQSQYAMGTHVSKSELQPGDLVFFFNTNKNVITHVGVYIGNGQFVHASSYYGITIGELESSYYKNRFYGATRIL